MSLADNEQVLKQIKGEIKLALARAIATGAETATNEEQCEAVRDLAQAFIFLPVMGDLPDFVHGHAGGGGMAMMGMATPTPSPVGGHAHGTPTTTPAPTPAPIGGHAHGVTAMHHSAPGVAPLPAALEERLDVLLDQAGVDDAAADAGETGTGTGTTPTPAPTPAPTPITPAQMRLEQALEEARIALIDALAELAKHALQNSACMVLLSEAFSLLPFPNLGGVMAGHSHAGGPAPGHSHGTPTPAPTPAPAPGHGHGTPQPIPQPIPQPPAGHAHGF